LALIPVTVTWTSWAELKVQDRFELPEPAMPIGVTEQDVLFVAKLTTPAKPLRPVAVIVEMPGDPARTITLVGLAEIVKSWTVNVTVAVCERLGLVPVTVT
jgi:predicted NBD/HSP70 family sugar kinase